MSVANPTSVSYRIQPSSPEAHLFHVELLIQEPAIDGQVLSMPAWIPGSYMIRDFAKHVIAVRAQDSGGRVALTKLDKQTWRCDPGSGPLHISYDVYAWDLSVRGAHLDRTHAYFNGTSVFLTVNGLENIPCRIELLRPQGEAYKNWRVATTLPVDGAAPFDFGRYRAADYADLIDHPVEMGEFSLTTFSVGDVPHDIVISGRHKADLERLRQDLAPICEQHRSLFGELPVPRYLFQVLAVGDGYGGLEHRNSTSLMCKRTDLPAPGDTEISNDYRQFLGLCSHEYFHLWNVKRIRPQVFMDATLQTEAYTRLLWVFEGITSYYDDLALVRSRCINPESYLELLAITITRLLRGAGRTKQSIVDSSFDAWTKFYKQDENAPNAIVSYYTKGAVIALALDLTLRLETNGKTSLDDLMLALWQRFGKANRGVAEDDVEYLAAEISGLDLREFFDLALRSTDDLPLAALLQQFGVGMHMRPARDEADQGGIPKSGSAQPRATPRPVLGARFSSSGKDATLIYVLDNGAAQKAGLAAGDTIVAVDGIRAQPDNLEHLIAAVPQGESVDVHAFRRDELMRFRVKPQPAPADTCELRLVEHPDANQQARLDAWLQGPNSPTP